MGILAVPKLTNASCFFRPGLVADIVQEIIFEVIHLHSWQEEKRMRINGEDDGFHLLKQLSR